MSQITYLKPGNHTLTFYAQKGSGSVDVWVQVFANGSWQYGPSLAAQLTYAWKSFSYNFSVSGSNHEPVQIHLIAGSVPGFAWIDDVSIMVDAEEDRVNPYDQPTSYGKIATVGTKVRNAPNGEKAIGHWNPNAEFMILDTISAGGYDWLKTIWGPSGAYAYI